MGAVLVWCLRAAAALLAVLPFLPPILARLGLDAAAVALDAVWAPLCHRIPERCILWLGTTMPVCSRCLGLIVGLGAGIAIARPLLSPRILVAAVGLASVLLGVELVTQEVGLHPVFHPTRLLSGLLLAYPIGGTAGALARAR
jgi:uncharacterized membrane protein